MAVVSQAVENPGSALAREINALFSQIRPMRIIETGTYHGTGTTCAILEALQFNHLSEARFFTIEVNPSHFAVAETNLRSAVQQGSVTLINGLSIPRALLPLPAQIKQEFVEGVDNLSDRKIFVDHSPETRITEYVRETDHPVLDDALGRCLALFNYAPDVVLLDSAGHVGQIEFEYLIKLLKSPCHIILDDVHHVKHCRSLARMRSDDRFTILVESAERMGFCIARFIPNAGNSVFHTQKSRRVFYPLGHLPRNGGTKVVLQHTHLLNEMGIPAYVVTPTSQASPFPRYHKARFLTREECIKSVAVEDIFVFCWAGSISDYAHLNNKFYFFSQGVINKSDPIPFKEWLNPRFNLITIGQHSRNFYFYGYGVNSHIVNNWVDTELFAPEIGAQVPKQVGMIKHRNYLDECVINKIEAMGFPVLQIEGDESEIAQQLRSCEYFVSCSKGISNGHDVAEGFPLPSAEAMASGCIVVSYNNHGCLEYIMDRVNGYVAWNNTVEDLLATISFASSDKNKAKVRDNARLTMRERFCKERISTQLVKALAETNHQVQK